MPWIAAIGTGLEYGFNGLSLTSDDPSIREKAAERMRERALGLDFRRSGSLVQGVTAVPESDDDTDTEAAAEDRPRETEDQP